MAQIEKIIKSEGHLIDSNLMRQIFDTIIADGGSYDILEFNIGKNNNEVSQTKLKIKANNQTDMNVIILKLSSLGCQVDELEEVILKDAPTNGVVPSDFYSSTNHFSEVRHNGKFLTVEKLRMDGVIVIENNTAYVKKFRDIIKGDKVVTGLHGVKITPEFAQRDRSDFSFMSGDVSTERKVRLFVDKVAELLKAKDKKVVAVAGPVCVHTGGDEDLGRLIKHGYINGLLSGNALAVHDIESNLYDTSLGINLTTGKPVEMGHRNHLRAINEVRRAGSIANLVNEGTLTAGTMYETIKAKIPFSLAGSLRDDGPLPDTITDMNDAQNHHFEILKNTDIVLMLSSMLHSIAVGNMIPAKVTTVCIDINPAVVTKLKDRGSMQTIGLVTDVGLFLHLLAEKLINPK